MSGGAEEIMGEAAMVVREALDNRQALEVLENIGAAAIEAGDAAALEELAGVEANRIMGADLKIPTPEEMAAGGAELLASGGGGGNLLGAAEDGIQAVNKDGFQAMEVVRDVPQVEADLKDAFFKNDGAAPAKEPVDAPRGDNYAKVDTADPAEVGYVAGGKGGGVATDAFEDELTAERLKGRIKGFGGGGDLIEPEDILDDAHAVGNAPDELDSFGEWKESNPTGTRDEFVEFQKNQRGVPNLDAANEDTLPYVDDGLGRGIERDGLLEGDGEGRPALDPAGSSNKLKLALIGAAVVAAGGVAVAAGAGAFDKEKSEHINNGGKQPDQGHDVNNPDGHEHTEGPAEQNNDPNHPDDPSHPGNNGQGQNGGGGNDGGQPKQDWGEFGPDGAVESDIMKDAISAAEAEAEAAIQQSRWGILPVLIAGVAIANI